MVEERGSVRGWLLTVARNIVTDRARAKAGPADRGRRVADHAAGRGDHSESVVNTMVVMDALNQVSAEHRDVLVELYYRGRTVTEAATALGIPPGTVKSRSYYALRALRAAIGGPDGGGPMTAQNTTARCWARTPWACWTRTRRSAVDEHLAAAPTAAPSSTELDEMNDLLGEVPPEAFLDGPPEDGDLLLQRTLRQVRAEAGPVAGEPPATTRRERPGTTRRGLLVAAGVILVAGAGLGGGVVIGQNTADPVAARTADVPGTRKVNTTDAGTGTSIAATVVPKAGWVSSRPT